MDLSDLWRLKSSEFQIFCKSGALEPTRKWKVYFELSLNDSRYPDYLGIFICTNEVLSHTTRFGVQGIIGLLRQLTKTLRHIILSMPPERGPTVLPRWRELPPLD